MRKPQPASLTKLIQERIEILFKEAEKQPELANRYVFLARKMAMRYNARIPKELKRKFCHHCYHFFTAKNLKARINSKNKAVEYLCKDCGKITRYGYRK